MLRRSRAIVIITAAALLFGSLFATVPARAATINDITDHWAQAEITALVDAGVIRGYSDGTFRPNANISRAEFVTLINRAAGLSVGTYGGTFKDVKAADWYAGDVATAVDAGYIKGYDDGTFGPTKSITRNEVAVVLTRAMALRIGIDTKAFTDDQKIPAWAVDSVQATAQAGFMKGYEDGSFGGDRNLTRAEAAVLISRARAQLTDYLTNPHISIAAFGYPSATVARRAEIGLAISNDGSALAEKVGIDITVTRTGTPLTSGMVTTEEYVERINGWLQATNRQFDASAGKATSTLATDGGYGMPAKHQAVVSSGFTFAEVGTYDVVLQVRGLTSNQALGDPWGFQIGVSELGVTFTAFDQATGLTQHTPINITNAGNVAFAENVIPMMVFTRLDGSGIKDGDITLQYYGPTDHIISTAALGYDPDSQSLVGPVAGYSGVQVAAGQRTGGPTAMITVNTPGQYLFGVVLMGAETGAPYGSPGFSFVKSELPPSASHASAGLTNRVTMNEGDTATTYLDIATYGGVLPEKAKVRLVLTGQQGGAIAAGDLTISYYDFQSNSYLPVQFTQTGPGRFETTWTETWLPDGMAVGYEYQLPVKITGRAGSYLLSGTVVGASGKVYTATPTNSFIDIRRLATTITWDAGDGPEYDLTLTTRNARKEALGENAIISGRIDIHAVDVATAKSVTLSYLDPTDNVWKDAAVKVDDYGHITFSIGGPGGFALAANSDLVLKLKVSSPVKAFVPYFFVDVTGPSGTFYGTVTNRPW